MRGRCPYRSSCTSRDRHHRVAARLRRRFRPKLITSSRSTDREQRVHDMLDPDDRRRRAARISLMVSMRSWHSFSVSPPAISSSSSSFGSVASARASSSRLRSSSGQRCRPRRLALASRPVRSSRSTQRSLHASARERPRRTWRRPADSRTPSCPRTAAGSGRSGRCRRGSGACGAAAGDVAGRRSGCCRRRAHSRR